MASTGDRERLEAYERDFRRAGLPLFIEDRSPFEDVFNRAVPFLGVVFVLGMLGAASVDWNWWQNVAAVLGGLAILLAAIGLGNRVRGRPFLAVPQRLGRAELAGFVLIPALIPLIFGGRAGEAIVTAAGNLIVLAVVYVIVAYGLISILRWVLGRLARQLRSALTLMARAVPLLAIFVLLSFPTEELWAIFSNPTGGVYATIIALFAGLGTAFLAVRLPREARALERQAAADSPPLRRRQAANVGLVMFVSQAVQVLLVSLMIGLFLCAFGLLAVGDELRQQWLGSTGNELLAFDLFGERLELTSELLRVAGGLAAFSGFYFSIAIFTDSTYRQEFLDELTAEMSESFRERAEYLRLRSASARR